MKNEILCTIAVIFVTVFVTSCKKSETEPQPQPPVAASISLISGNNQQSEVQAPLPAPIEVSVKDQYGNPFPGVKLTIDIEKGGGVISPSNPTTNHDGKASIIWVLGNKEGAQELIITAQNSHGTQLSGSPITIKATATSKPPEASSIELLSGTDQTGIVNEVLPMPVEVLVKDQHGQGFAGANVDFSVAEGSLSQTSIQTDINGKASVTWTLGASTGIQELTITALQAGTTASLYGSPLIVTARAHAPTEVTLQPITFPTDIRGAAVDLLFPNPIIAVVKDESGNVMEGVKVTFSVEEGFLFPIGSDVGSRFVNIYTDINGKAKTKWKLGSSYGTQTIKASIITANGSPITNTLNIIGMLSDVEGNLYQTIEIGDQLWMAENLRSTKYNDGTEIPYISNPHDWEINTSNPAFCWYYNSEYEYKEDYGALYNWHVVATDKLCPSDWRVPTDNDWTVLINALGGEGLAGGKLKEAGTSHWKSPNTGASNEAGFKARPGGHRNFAGVFYGAVNKTGSYGYWWSATVMNSETAWSRIMYYDNSTVFRHNSNKRNGYSIRCINTDD